MGRHRHRGGHRAGHAYRTGGYRRPKYNVPVNIIEKEKEFEAWVYALGFSKENIRITVSNDVLYISGERTPEEDPHFLLQEYPIRAFERWFELSERADQSRITARVENGILIITVPKIADAVSPDVEVRIS